MWDKVICPGFGLVSLSHFMEQIAKCLLRSDKSEELKIACFPCLSGPRAHEGAGRKSLSGGGQGFQVKAMASYLP